LTSGIFAWKGAGFDVELVSEERLAAVAGK
jgi:hypothetical protein